ncbi:MAG: hypothetical protein V1921_06390 [Candidatus Altiarchaeota archaeon]
MTGTKVVKLRLDEEGSVGRLPNLMDAVVEKAVSVFARRNYFTLAKDGGEAYDHMLKDVQGFDVSRSQLQGILGMLEEKYKHSPWRFTMIGPFLSALVEKSHENEFELVLTDKVQSIGYRLRDGKRITCIGDVGSAGDKMSGGLIMVKGDIGDLMGRDMTGGKIIVAGGAGNQTGYHMSGGEIEIKKSARDYPGCNMSGGKIKIGENAGNYAGFNMSKGEIHILGNANIGAGSGMSGGKITVDGRIFGLIRDVKGGEIWEGGTQIWPKQK